jgi:hypothetical protein
MFKIDVEYFMKNQPMIKENNERNNLETLSLLVVSLRTFEGIMFPAFLGELAFDITESGLLSNESDKTSAIISAFTDISIVALESATVFSTSAKTVRKSMQKKLKIIVLMQ